MSIEVVGVIGAGVMGVGVAQNLAQTGHRVILLDTSDDILESAVQKIRQNVRFSRLFNKTSPQDPLEEVMERITTTTTYDPLHKADFVVENVVEKWDVKKEIYPQLDQVCPEHCVFAANTSCISITKIGSVTNRPDRIIGMHFMNPVPLMVLVEGISGLQTSPETFSKVKSFAEYLGKTFVEAKDMPGFAVNRILMPMINEAVYTLHEGIASVEDIDAAMKLGTNQPMGPLTLADFIGLDTCLAIMNVLHDGLGDTKYRPCPLLVKYVEAGWLGRKSGRGFYNYAAQ